MDVFRGRGDKKMYVILAISGSKRFDVGAYCCFCDLGTCFFTYRFRVFTRVIVLSGAIVYLHRFIYSYFPYICSLVLA